MRFRQEIGLMHLSPQEASLLQTVVAARQLAVGRSRGKNRIICHKSFLKSADNVVSLPSRAFEVFANILVTDGSFSKKQYQYSFVTQLQMDAYDESTKNTFTV